MRYRLRTLMIVLALAPPLLAWCWLNYPREQLYRPSPESLAVTARLEAALVALASIPAGNTF
jgi:hypothetical protein